MLRQGVIDCPGNKEAWQVRTDAVQGILVSYIGKIRNNTTKWTDERVRLAGEAVSGCLAVKMLGSLRNPLCHA